MNSKIVCIDFDGTTCGTDNRPMPGAVDAVKLLQNSGFEVVIYTARLDGKQGAEAARIQKDIGDWCVSNQIRCGRIEAKPAAVAYIDNRAVRYDGKENSWSAIAKQLVADNTARAEEVSVEAVKAFAAAGGKYRTHFGVLYSDEPGSPRYQEGLRKYAAGLKRLDQPVRRV